MEPNQIRAPTGVGELLESLRSETTRHTISQTG